MHRERCFGPFIVSSVGREFPSCVDGGREDRERVKLPLKEHCFWPVHEHKCRFIWWSSFRRFIDCFPSLSVCVCQRKKVAIQRLFSSFYNDILILYLLVLAFRIFWSRVPVLEQHIVPKKTKWHYKQQQRNLSTYLIIYELYLFLYPCLIRITFDKLQTSHIHRFKCHSHIMIVQKWTLFMLCTL